MHSIVLCLASALSLGSAHVVKHVSEVQDVQVPSRVAAQAAKTSTTIAGPTAVCGSGTEAVNVLYSGFPDLPVQCPSGQPWGYDYMTRNIQAVVFEQSREGYPKLLDDAMPEPLGGNWQNDCGPQGDILEIPNLLSGGSYPIWMEAPNKKPGVYRTWYQRVSCADGTLGFKYCATGQHLLNGGKGFLGCTGVPERTSS